jgi:hypothetical protein
VPCCLCLLFTFARCGPMHGRISHAAQRQWSGLAGRRRHMKPQLAPPRSACSCPCSAATRCCAAASASAPCHTPDTGQNDCSDRVVGAGSTTCTASGGQPGCTNGPWPLVMATAPYLVRSRQPRVQGITNSPVPADQRHDTAVPRKDRQASGLTPAAAAKTEQAAQQAQGGDTELGQQHSFGTCAGGCWWASSRPQRSATSASRDRSSACGRHNTDCQLPEHRGAQTSCRVCVA